MVDFELLCRRLIGSRCGSREGFGLSSSFSRFACSFTGILIGFTAYKVVELA
jgi:hypothetical protein